MWLEYLVDRIDKDKNVLDKLYEIDYDFYTSMCSLEYLTDYIDKNININKFFNLNIDDTTFLLEGAPTALISVINDYYDKNIEVIINDSNIAFNMWIKKVYDDYCIENNINNKLNIIINNHFKVNTNNVVVIGSNGFITEMKMCLKEKNIITYEYEE